MIVSCRSAARCLALLILLTFLLGPSSSFTQDVGVVRCSRDHCSRIASRIQGVGGGTSAPSDHCREIHHTTKLRLASSDDNDQSEESSAPGGGIRYLGKGERAIVRPGVVLVAPGHESSHFLMKSAIFVHAMGLDEYGESVTRGVIIDHPTAFTMGEMGGGSVAGVLGNNILFRGGDSGRDTAILLHSHGDTIEACSDVIGNSAIYEGGLQAAMEAADEGIVNPDNFKFFFNYVQFTDNEINSMLEEEDSSGDAWMSVEVPHEFVLDGDYNRGEAWSYLRNQIKQMQEE